MDGDHGLVGLAAALDRMRDAVRTVALADHDPSDPYRGLYVSDESAMQLGSADPPLEREQRFDQMWKVGTRPKTYPRVGRSQRRSRTRRHGSHR